jgi:hypothetical protein
MAAGIVADGGADRAGFRYQFFEGFAFVGRTGDRLI